MKYLANWHSIKTTIPATALLLNYIQVTNQDNVIQYLIYISNGWGCGVLP